MQDKENLPPEELELQQRREAAYKHNSEVSRKTEVIQHVFGTFTKYGYDSTYGSAGEVQALCDELVEEQQSKIQQIP